MYIDFVDTTGKALMSVTSDIMNPGLGDLIQLPDGAIYQVAQRAFIAKENNAKVLEIGAPKPVDIFMQITLQALRAGGSNAIKH